MSFEGLQIQGAPKIMEKLNVSFTIFGIHSYMNMFLLIGIAFLLQSLTFQKISRVITAVDSQPMYDGGVLINVLGRLQVSFSILLFSYLMY